MPAAANTAEQKHTPGPWHAGHLADDSHPCNCQSVLSECYMGAICTIEFDNGLRVSEGGNDASPLEEAKANMRLIAAAPEMFLHGGDLIASLDPSTLNPEQFNAWSSLSAALAKADGAAS